MNNHLDFISRYNSTSVEFPEDRTVHELFEQQVEKTPDETAVSWGKESLSYQELNMRANRFARYLKREGLKAGSLVAILTDHTPELLTGIFGILKAGAAYVPIDREYPDDRIKYILSDCDASFLVTHGSIKKDCTFFERVLYIDDAECRNEDCSDLKESVPTTNLAYIIYTSGSTGNPKGVEIEHKSLVNYSLWAWKSYINEGKYTVPLYSSPSFDLTVTSIFMPLISGNTIRLYKSNNYAFSIHAIMSENVCNFIKATPAHLKLINKYNLEKSGLRKFVIGGEALPSSLCREIDEKFNGEAEIYNEYGPTEATVGCMIYKYNPKDDATHSVSIGIPAANTRIYLLDDTLNHVKRDETGEIYISGKGLARGYRNLEKMTDERFIADPFVSGERMYKSGDLGCWLDNGTILYEGRSDEQVKIRGYRIETGEIEKKLLEYPGINDCIVIAREPEKDEGDKVLCAFFVASKEIGNNELASFLSEKMPSYMVPSFYYKISSVPMTVNGKVDRAKILHDFQ